MMEQFCSNENPQGRVLEARYAYYRRCQIFRKTGEQCKAPAEKGAHICYAHAREQATAFRRKLQVTILLAEVVRRMRQRGRPEFEITDIFMDFDAIQVTLAVMAQAVISGRVDCKTAGRLAIGLQTAAKLLRLHHRVHRGKQRQESFTAKVTKEHKGISGDPVIPPQPAQKRCDPGVLGPGAPAIGRSSDRIDIYRETSLGIRTIDVAESVRAAEVAIIRTVHRADIQRSTGPPEWVKAA